MFQDIEGKYFGTEINGNWWQRYTKNKMFARGNGTFSCNEQSISFLRRLTKIPITIKFADIIEFKTGSWHAGQWGAKRQIVKVVWKNDSQLLSSGFTLSKNTEETVKIIAQLNEILEARKNESS